MKMIVTTRELRYGGKPYARGESVEVHPKHAVALKILKKVADHPGEEPKPVRQVASTKAPKAKTKAKTPKAGGRYSTRHLTAED